MSPTRALLRRLRPDRHRIPQAGCLERIPDFASEILGNRRQITVYVPPGYEQRGRRRYPVLYVQDGQNLFDAGRAYIPGQHWRLKEAADGAIEEHDAAPMIIVGVDHAGTERIDELTPTRDAIQKRGGRLDDYGRMLIEELKPTIDSRFSTLTEKEQTGIAGSSLGGLAAMHLVLTRSDVFGRAAAMSPSVWWEDRAILRELDAFEGPPPRLWIDVGAREGAEALRDARALRLSLEAKRWPAGTYRYFEDRRGDHSERAWARRARMALEFLFPPASFPRPE
jgi:predicted alpha/beta superfamily hydrolase